MTVTTFAIYSLEAGLYKTCVCVSLASLFFDRRIPHSLLYLCTIWILGSRDMDRKLEWLFSFNYTRTT